MARRTVRLLTSGMHCGSCAMLIDMTLSDVDGVEESKTDHATGETVVTYDDEKVEPALLVDAVKGAGYGAEIAS